MKKIKIDREFSLFLNEGIVNNRNVYVFGSLQFNNFEIIESYLLLSDFIDVFLGFNVNILNSKKDLLFEDNIVFSIKKMHQEMFLCVLIDNCHEVYFSKLQAKQFATKINRILSKCDAIASYFNK